MNERLREHLLEIREDFELIGDDLGRYARLTAEDVRTDVRLLFRDAGAALDALRLVVVAVLEREVERVAVPIAFIGAMVVALVIGAIVTSSQAGAPADGPTRELSHTEAGSIRPPAFPPPVLDIGTALTPPALAITPRPPSVGTGPAPTATAEPPSAPVPALAPVPTAVVVSSPLQHVDVAAPGVWITEATFRAALAVSSWEPWNRERVVAIAFCESGDATLRVIRLDTVGRAGELGPLQIHPPSHPEFAGHDLFDLATNLEDGHTVFVEAGRSFWPWSCAR